jgi:hypothetical protein
VTNGGLCSPAWSPARSSIDFFDHYLEDQTAALDRLRTDANVTGKSSLQATPS